MAFPRWLAFWRRYRCSQYDAMTGPRIPLFLSGGVRCGDDNFGSVRRIENRFSRIDTDLAILKWMTGTILAGVVAVRLAGYAFG
jgi:hypothetical protein